VVRILIYVTLESGSLSLSQSPMNTIDSSP